MPSTARWISKFKIKPYSWVFVPNKETIQEGRSIKSSIEKQWSSPVFYYHLRDGGHVKALKAHMENQFFIHLDIQDFFGSINRSRVTRCLKGYYSYEDSRDIAIASTVRVPENTDKKYSLPFGFVQSPIIASLCLQKSRLGKYLKILYKTTGISVSVYMDDIIISGNNIFCLKLILEEVKSVSDKSRFILNREKEEGPSKMITAFNIELSHKLLKISNIRFNNLCFDYKTAISDNQRDGILGYIYSVNQRQAEILYASENKT
jgi:hypothetical protein